MEKAKNKSEPPPEHTDAAFDRLAATGSPGSGAEQDANAGAQSGDPGDAGPHRTAGSVQHPKDQTRPEPDYLSIFTDNVTESGSFRIPAGWSDPFWNILHALPVPALVVDRSHEISFANSACRQALESQEDLKGKPFSCLFREASGARDAEQIADNVYHVKTPRTLEVGVSHGNKKIWVRLHYRSLRIDSDRFVLVLIEDLTVEREKLELIERHREELSEARDELDRSNAQLRLEAEERRKAQAKIERAKLEWERTFDAVPDLISIMDMDHRILRVNKALADKLGMTYLDIVGTQCFCTVHGSNRPHEACPHTEFIRDGQPHRREVVDERHGEVFDVSVSPLHDERHRLVGSVHVARDITEVKKAQRLILESGRARAVAELAGMVAHSFNNLLQMAMGGAQLSLTNLELGNYSDVKNTLGEIVEDLRQGARAVKRLNFLARAYSDSPAGEPRVLDLSAAVHQALDMASPWWQTLPEKAGIMITLKRDLGHGCFIKGDADQIFEAVVDLVRNAAEALPQGGTIHVRTRRDGNWATLQIRDNGVGIRQESLSKIFEPLWTTKGPTSTGMGLARVRNIAHSHGGKISVDSELGQGTSVTILFPPEQAPQDKPEAFSMEEPGPSRRILLVDDMEPVLKMLSQTAQQFGHTVFSCLSGPRALELAAASRFDVVICDLGMPGMNGWQVAESLKASAEKSGRPKTPFILLTGWGDQTGQEHMLAESGVDAVLEKPIDAAELMRVIRRLTGAV